MSRHMCCCGMLGTLRSYANGQEFNTCHAEFISWKMKLRYHREKNIVKEIESIMGARVERSSPSWVCIPQKLLAIAHDFWNTNSWGWTLFRTGAHDGFSTSCLTQYMYHEYWCPGNTRTQGWIPFFSLQSRWRQHLELTIITFKVISMA